MENMYKTISTFIDLSHIEYYTYDLFQRKIVCSSGLAQKVLGYTEQDFFRLSENFCEAIIHPDDLGASKRTADEISNSSLGEIIENTYRLRKSDGSYLWIYARKTVVEWNAMGSPVIICAIAEDITEFIELENQLRERIKQLNDIAWKNAHLLRGPVARIIGLVNLIRESEISSQHNLQVFDYVKQTIEKLDSVIHEINEDANK